MVDKKQPNRQRMRAGFNIWAKDETVTTLVSRGQGDWETIIIQ